MPTTQRREEFSGSTKSQWQESKSVTRHLALPLTTLDPCLPQARQDLMELWDSASKAQRTWQVGSNMLSLGRDTAVVSWKGSFSSRRICLGQTLIVLDSFFFVTIGFQTPITNMLFQNQIDQPYVSVWLNKASEQDVKLSNGGEFIFGGVDPSLFTGDINWLSVTSSSQWQVAVDEVYIGRKELDLSKSSSYAVIDTGSSYILFPEYLATAFHRAIPNSHYDKDLGWMIPCTLAKSTSVGDLTFILKGQKYAVPLSDIVLLESGFNGICLSAVDSWSEATGQSGQSVSILIYDNTKRSLSETLLFDLSLFYSS